MVAASIGPTPGTLRKSAAFSRQRGLERMLFVQLVFDCFYSDLEPGDVFIDLRTRHCWRSAPTVALGRDHPQ